MDSSAEVGDELVSLCNGMLSQLHVNYTVKHWKDITPTIFITLFEGKFNTYDLPLHKGTQKNSSNIPRFLWVGQ